MSLFALHLEDASVEGTRLTDAVPGGLDESETATAEIADLRQEEAEIVEANAEAEDMGERVELAEELTETVEPVVTEGAGLDAASMKLLLTGMRRVAGPRAKHLVGRDVKMESISAGVSGRREQTRIQFENLKDTLKAAWEAIKAAFKKAWAKVKTWYIKTFDASKKLKARAEKIRSRAESGSATIDKKKFSFSGAKSLAHNGKLTASDLVSGMGSVKKIAENVLDTIKTDNVDDASDELVKLIGEEVSEDNLRATVVKIHDTLTKGINVAGGGKPSSVSDKIVSGFGEDVTLKFSEVLPGDKVIVVATGKETGEGDMVSKKIAAIRRSRVAFSGITDKVKEVSGEVETLSSSQVATVCDHVIDTADSIFDFKKGWENRDRSQEKVIKAIDDAFREITKDKEVDPKVQRTARSIAGAATDIIRRDATAKAAFVSYAMSTCNVALSYCERSMAQYKK